MSNGNGFFANWLTELIMDRLETELQKIYDSEIHLEIGWMWDGGIDIKVGGGEVSGYVKTVAEILPWIQSAIAEHFPDSKYHVERMGGKWKPVFFDPDRPRLSVVPKR